MSFFDPEMTFFQKMAQ